MICGNTNYMFGNKSSTSIGIEEINNNKSIKISKIRFQSILIKLYFSLSWKAIRIKCNFWVNKVSFLNYALRKNNVCEILKSKTFSTSEKMEIK